jgi:1-acyl-sn-glycerol-3-phosphate acyltransferase
VNKFDSIRPYNDNEVNDVLSQLSSNRRFLKMLFATGKFNQIRYLPFSRKILSLVLKNRIKNINDVNSYQNLFEGIVSGIVQQSINKFSIEGIKNLDSEKGYLYISNHRDITLDSALLNLTLHQNNLKTTYNAVGNNLLSEKWASDLMRLNKSFIIDRSDKSKRDIYKSLNLASEFIFNAIKNKNESVWIAQKQGRSKDGNDYTDPSVIKMIHLNSRKKVPVDQYLNSLNIVPVSISYEKDPNDLLKAKELYLTDLNQKYTKDRKEDMESISDGITGDKGDVHLSIGKIINFESDSYDDCSNQITKAIKDSYKLHPTNYAAAIIQGKDNPNNSNDLDKIDDAIQYLENRIKLLPEDMQSYLLNQYSNPVL